MINILLALAASVLTFNHDIRGTVVDENGKPVVGATVVVLHAEEASNDVTTETNAAGEFTLSRDHEGGKSTNFQLLAWKDEYAAAALQHSSSNNAFQLEAGAGAVEAFRLVMFPATEFKPVIVDPDGNPLVGAKVTPYYLGASSEYAYRESGLPDILASVSDASGQVNLKGLGAKVGGGFFIESENFGTQRFGYQTENTPPPGKIALAPTGSLRGRIVCDDPNALEEWQIRMNSSSAEPGSSSTGVAKTSGSAEVISSADGIFNVATLPAGKYSIHAIQRAKSRYTAEAATFEVAPGKETQVELKLKLGRRAFGRILEKDTDRPIVGAKLYFGGVQAESNETGAFEGYVTQPPNYVQIHGVPDGYIKSHFDSRTIEIADPEADEFEIGTIHLQAASPVTGVVTDDNGLPQSGIAVSAMWVQTSEGKFQTFTNAHDKCVTDADGKYRLQNSSGDAALLISALGSDRATKEPTRLDPMADRVVNLTVSRANTAHLTVVIKDKTGHPIPGASARLTYSLETADRGSMGGRSVLLAGKNSIVSDVNGLFRTAVRLPRHDKYSLAISADGFLPMTTEYKQLGGTDDEMLLGEFTLERAKSATGIIIDSAGKPVSGITVSAHGIPENSRDNQPVVNVQTDESGRFNLSPLHPAESVVTVRGQSWRPTGAAIPPGDGSISITVFRTDESIPDEHRVKTPESKNIPITAGISLLKQLMPDLRNSNYFNAAALALIGRVNPERIPDELAETKDASARVQALVTLKEFEDANAHAEQIEGGYGRAYARFKIIDACHDKDLNLQLIAAALIDAKSVQQPDRRAVVLASVADRLIKIDELDQAHTLLKDSLEQFSQLPATEWAGFAKGFYAERLARFDFETALAMLDGMEPDNRARHVGNMAHALAAVDPENAEKLIADSDETRSVIAYRIRVCYRMAAVDLERAERVRQGHPVRGNDTFAKEHSLGVMAMSVLSNDQMKAQQLLNQAWTELEATTSNRNIGSQSGGYRFGVALALLSYAEKIDPDNLTDHFWRAIALYPGPQGNSWEPAKQRIEDFERQAMLVLAFGLYDREPEMCRRIMAPAFEYWSKKENLQDHAFYRKTATFTAMAMAEPRRAAQWAVDAYGMMPEESRRLIPQPWLIVAQTLCNDRQAIQDMLADEVFTRWFIDKYDL